MSELATLVGDSDGIVFFGGAGVSTESGIPDFRSSTGLYSTTSGSYPPEYMLSRSCYDDHPSEFFDFYRGHLLYPDARPNAGHLMLARLEAAGRLDAVITQNIDGLHQLAGSQRVVELHGSVHRNPCRSCGAIHDLAFLVASTGVPTCPRCGGRVKPDVVLYEEGLKQEDLVAAMESIAAAKVLIVGGTSLNVYPAAGLVRYYRGDKLVLINKSATPYDASADLVIHERLGQVLTEAFG